MRNSICWLLKPGFLAAGASTGTGETLSVLKDVSTHQALKGFKNQLFSLGHNGPCDMRKMFIDLSFPYAYYPGEFPSCHLALSQQSDNLLTNRLLLIPMFLSPHFSPCTPGDGDFRPL